MDNPPLTIGDRCRLNSGSPDLLVVDFEDDTVIVSWVDWIRGKRYVCETELSRAMVRRVVSA